MGATAKQLETFWRAMGSRTDDELRKAAATGADQYMPEASLSRGTRCANGESRTLVFDEPSRRRTWGGACE